LISISIITHVSCFGRCRKITRNSAGASPCGTAISGPACKNTECCLLARVRQPGYGPVGVHSPFIRPSCYTC
jgi:hypothetical protein